MRRIKRSPIIRQTKLRGAAHGCPAAKCENVSPVLRSGSGGMLSYTTVVAQAADSISQAAKAEWCVALGVLQMIRRTKRSPIMDRNGQHMAGKHNRVGRLQIPMVRCSSVISF